MKRALLFVCLAGLLALSTSAFAQNASFNVAPKTGACGDTIRTSPGATVDIPINLLLSTDTAVSGFTVSLRVKSALDVTVVRDTSIRKAQFIELHFPVPPVPAIAGNEIGDPFVPFPVDATKDCGEGPLGGAPQGPGYTLGIVYFIGLNPDTFEPLAITLPPGDDIIVDESLTISVVAPAADQAEDVEIVFEDGMCGLGSPTSNIATINQQSVTPEKGSCTLTISTEVPPGGVIPGDTDASGDLSAMDAIDLLDHFFRGTVDLPCGDSVRAAANITLLDSNGDSEIDLSDSIWILRSIFLDAPDHVLGTGCTQIAGCDITCQI